MMSSKHRLVLMLLIKCVCVRHVWTDLPLYYITDMCNKSLNMTASNATDLHSVRLKSSKEEYYPHYLSCSLQILAEQNTEHLMIQFLHFDVRPEHYPEFCGYDYLDVRDGNSSNSPYVCGIDRKLCGISPSRSKGVYVTCSHQMVLHFASSGGGLYTGFDMVITSFRYGTCTSNEFECGNGRCIAQDLLCNGFNPCGDRSDCSSLSVSSYLAIVFGSLLLVTCITIIIACKKGILSIKGKNSEYLHLMKVQNSTNENTERKTTYTEGGSSSHNE